MADSTSHGARTLETPVPQGNDAVRDRDWRLFRLGVTIAQLRPEIASRWLLPGEQVPS